MTRQDNAAPSQIERRAVLAAVKTAKRRLRRWPSASPDCCSTRRKWDEQAGAKKRRSKPNKETLISKKGLAKSSAIKERESRLANRTGKLDLGARRLDVSVALRIERDNADRRPVTRVPTPALRVALPRTLIDRVAGFEQMAIPAGMTLCRSNIADAAVPVLVVV